MAEKKQFITYNTKVNMKAEINPAFISGLQQIYYRYITEFYPEFDKIGEIINTFNLLLSNDDKAKAMSLTPLESEMYTLYAVIHLLKSYAKEQGLEMMEEIDIDSESFDKIAKDSMNKNNNPTDALREIADKIAQMQIVK
jgi:hypothetical protein